MIRSHISSIKNCGVILKFERFSYLSKRSFGLTLLSGSGTYQNSKLPFKFYIFTKIPIV